MLYYILIIIASLLFSLQFVFNSGYEKRSGSSWQSALNFSFYSAAAGWLVVFSINGFSMEISWFSCLVALVYSVAGILYSYASVKSFESANLSMYSMFAMLGGMALPFLFGIVRYGEAVSFWKILGCALIGLALVLQTKKGKGRPQAVKYYFLVFVLNGMFGVLSKLHQMNPVWSVDSSSFLMLSNIWSMIFCVLLKLRSGKGAFRISAPALACCAGYAVFSAVGNLFLLISLNHLPASVQYPIVTGGVIVISTLIACLRKEGVTFREAAAAMIAFLSTALMAL